MTRMLCAVLLGVVFAALSTLANPAAAACTIQIGTAAALNNIRNNMAGDSCLTASINAASLGNFVPLGTAPDVRYFTGTLDGKGFAISNLKIDDAAADITGFFRIIDGGTVKNIRFLNANIKSATRSAGVITGSMRGATGAILNSSATGKIEGTDGDLGGLAGACSDNAKITDSFFDGAVIGINSKFSVGGVLGVALSGCTLTRTYAAGSVSASEANGSFHNVGGLLGNNSSGIVTRSFAKNRVSATASTSFDILSVGGAVGDNLLGDITETYATGPVTMNAGNTSSKAGGLVGDNSNTISRSFSTGPVTIATKGYGGGLAGFSSSKAITDSYSTSPVSGNKTAADGGPTAGFVGGLGTDGAISRSFSAGKVVGAVGKTGGLVAFISSSGPVTQSHWDVNTSGQSTSAIGTSKTTGQLRAALQSGFAAPTWGITPQVTYPFLLPPTITFSGTLSTTVKASRLFSFTPISQRDRTQYAGAVTNITKSSEAAVYTILARAIAITKSVPALSNIKINTTYWHDASQTTTFNGPITSHATRGPLIAIASATPINAPNILGKLKTNNVVLIQGPSAVGTHSMLATSYTVNAGGAATALVALDPYTGQQVRINPTTKKVVSPASFPLTTFKVSAYRVITLVP